MTVLNMVIKRRVSISKIEKAGILILIAVFVCPHVDFQFELMSLKPKEIDNCPPQSPRLPWCVSFLHHSQGTLNMTVTQREHHFDMCPFGRQVQRKPQRKAKQHHVCKSLYKGFTSKKTWFQDKRQTWAVLGCMVLGGKPPSQVAGGIACIWWQKSPHDSMLVQYVKQTIDYRP